jgi:hypothetical protein
MNSKPALAGQTILEHSSFYENEICGCGEDSLWFLRVLRWP